MSESDYKSLCLQVDYKDFEEDLNAHKGELVHIKGGVLGVSPADEVPLPSLSAVTPGLLGSVSVDLGHVDSSEYRMNAEVLWPEPLPDVRFGTGQVVEVWGECQGAVNYELDASLDPLPNIPVVCARYMTVHTPQGPTSSTSAVSPTTLPSIPAGWVVFEGEGVSVALPASFSGGESARSEVSLARMHNMTIDLLPVFVQGEHSVTPLIEGLLFMSGEATTTGFEPEVGVARVYMGTDVSDMDIGAFVQSRLPHFTRLLRDSWAVATVTIESIDSEEARLVVLFPLSREADEYTAEYWVFRSAGQYLYRVVYRTDLQSAEELFPIFRISRRTIVVEGQRK